MGKHLREVHIRAEAVVCSACGKTLARKDSAERHKRTCRAKSDAVLPGSALTDDDRKEA